MGVHVICIKLVDGELAALDQLQLLGNFESRSGVLRAGLGLLFEKHKLKKSAELAIEAQREKHRPRSRMVRRLVDAAMGESFQGLQPKPKKGKK
jgi:Arc/MetJ-type ribon-helix-helix transcriptional regulator